MTHINPETPASPVTDPDDVPRVDFDVHSGEDLGELDGPRTPDEDGTDWPAGGAPDTDADATSTDPNETGPNGEAVHQSDS